MLIEKQRSDYEGKGYLVIENAIDASELSQLCKAFEQETEAKDLGDLHSCGTG